MIPKRLDDIITDLRKQTWVENLLISGNLYLVGGCVRDAYRDKDIKDIDIIVEKLSIGQIKHLLFPYGNVRLVGESFAVIKFNPDRLFGEPYDISVPRIDRKIGEGHKGFAVDTKGVSLYKDLERRDFTINSIAINIESGEVIDPYNGIQDIEWRVLRATNKDAFIEDPLRILRGIQFSARFGYKIDIPTMRLMQENSYLIRSISGERIMEEFMKIINKNGNTQIALDLLYKTGTDIALFEKKMLQYDKGFEYLDAISFFYLLGILGDVDPSKFVLDRLKGECNLAKEIRTLNQLLERLPHVEHDREDFLYMLSKSFSEAPAVMEAVILPDSVSEVVSDMRLGKIPFSMKSVQVNGDDVIKFSAGSLKDKEVGIMLERVLRDALMNRFNWKKRNDSTDYLVSLIYGK